MKIKDLRKALAEAPDNAVLVVPTSDHGYRPAKIEISTALDGNPGLTEDFGEEVTPESEYGKRINIVLVV